MSGPKVWCRLGHQAAADSSGPFCQIHPGVELTELPEDLEPVVEPDRDQRRTTCWRCHALSTHVDNDSCPDCHESLVPPVLVIDFPDGPVMLRDRPSSAMLGRAGEHSRIFAKYPNVSRQHATISVDEAGDAWLTPIPEAPNGTFVNGREIQVRTAIAASDRIRFGTDQPPRPGPVSEPVRQPFREP